ncbi:hypothetical protein MMC24_003843 [Lignoscripta atroalba]|nr:hypothetical protein [Lignoscripta atroalba]
MHIKPFLAASLIAFAASARAEMTITELTPEQTAQVDANLAPYYSSLTAQPAYTSVLSVLSTALPGPVYSYVEAAIFKDLKAAASVPTLPASGVTKYLNTLPTDVKNYISSVANDVIAIESKVVSGEAPRPTGVVAMGWVAAAGVVLLAML